MEFIAEYFIPIVLVACLVVGYIMKNFLPNDNRWIPLTLAVLGAVLGCCANQHVDLTSIVGGAVSGLSAVGLHQIFKQFINDGTIIYDRSKK